MLVSYRTLSVFWHKAPASLTPLPLPGRINRQHAAAAQPRCRKETNHSLVRRCESPSPSNHQSTAKMSAKGPDLKRYMEKKLLIRLVGKRKLTGYLRGYDQFMNLVVEDAVELISLTEKTPIGTVVIRGNSVENFELQESEAVIDRATGAVVG